MIDILPSFFDCLAAETNLYAQQWQTNQTWNGIPPLLKKWKHLLEWMLSWALTRSLSCATTGLQTSSWGMWGYNVASRAIVLSHCVDISTSMTHKNSQLGMIPLCYTNLGQYLTCASTRFWNSTFQARRWALHDETMVKYKGGVFFRQYMPKKPIKWGIKVWMLAEPSDRWRKPLTSRTLTCQHPSSHTINTWEVSTWTTSWGLTIPLLDQELSGGDTFFGSSLMLQSSTQWFWNTFLLSNYHQDVTPSNLILPSSSLVGSVGGRGILIRKERAPPWLWLYLIFQDIGKWNFLGGRERASTAVTMDTKPPLVALPKQHSDVVAVK